MKRRKLRKPFDFSVYPAIRLNKEGSMVFIGNYPFPRNQVKNLQLWLGQAIAYLEQRDE